MIVAFSGKIGSGKTTLTTELAAQLGWPRTSFGDYVRSCALQRGIEITRENLQNLGQKLLAENPKLFCENVLNQAVWRPEGNLILDGIRHIQILTLIIELIQPFEFIHIHIESDAQNRSARLNHCYSPVEIQRMDDHSTELDVKYALGDQADLILKNDTAIVNLLTEVQEFLKL